MKLFDDHIEAQENLKYWKERELELRLKICNPLLEGKSVGTHNIKKGKYKLKACKKVNYNFDEEILDNNWDDLSDDEQDCVKFKPSLRLKEYKNLHDRKLLDEAIEVVPATPTLNIEYVEE